VKRGVAAAGNENRVIFDTRSVKTQHSYGNGKAARDLQFLRDAAADDGPIRS
jgi:hypothetical protein